MKKMSYIQLLKEAVGEYSKIPQTVDAKGPMIDDIMGYDGTGELKTRKDAASILERYYFSEEEAGPEKPVGEEPDTEPAGDKEETKDGKGGDLPKEEIEDELALEEDEDMSKEHEEGETKEEEKKEEEKKKEDEDKEELKEAYQFLKEDANQYEDDEEEKHGSPLSVVAARHEAEELEVENAVISKLIEQMEASTVEEPGTEPAGDPEETKDGKGKEVDVDSAFKDITSADDVKPESVEEMFSIFREAVEADETMETGKTTETGENGEDTSDVKTEADEHEETKEEEKKEEEKEEEPSDEELKEAIDMMLEAEEAEEKKEKEEEKDEENKEEADEVKV